MTIQTLSELGIASGAWVMIIVGALMFLAAWRDDRDRMMKYPPATMLAVGAPIFTSGIIALAHIGHKWDIGTEVIAPGTVGFAILGTVGGLLWINLLLLLATGNLTPPYKRERGGDDDDRV